MLTVKFIGSTRNTIISCERCDISERNGMAFVVVHRNAASDSGVEFVVAPSAGNVYESAFIRNAQGVVLERAGPYEDNGQFGVANDPHL